MLARFTYGRGACLALAATLSGCATGTPGEREEDVVVDAAPARDARASVDAYVEQPDAREHLSCRGDHAANFEHEVKAEDSPEALDCDDYVSTVSGVLSGASDEDWYLIRGIDTRAGGCTHTARVDVEGAKVCIFAQCALATNPTTNCRAGVEATSPEGRPGCCSQQAGNASLEITCRESGSELTLFYIRVSNGPPGACTEYEREYEATSS